FHKALSYKSELITTPIEKYDGLLLSYNETGKNPHSSLYEFILQAYKNFNIENSQYFSRDFQQYKTNDTTWFTLDYTSFINKNLDNKTEGIDIKKYTIQSFQLLTAYYQSKNEEQKLAKLDFERIEYLRNNFLFLGEKQVMGNIMTAFAKRYSKYSIAAKA